MKKQYLLLMLVLSGSAFAKVTYDDAVNSSSDYHSSNEEQSLSPRVGFGLGPDELQDDGSGDGWISHWNGKTVGSVSIPRNATEVFVKYQQGGKNASIGYKSFPVNAGSINIGSQSASWNSSSQNHDNSCSASATATYSNFVVKGDKERTGIFCDVAVYITSVMYR
jgi:hypothetical protein